MRYYKITKNYKGGSNIYYIALDEAEEVTEDMLEGIGENTSGGHAYGYRMDSEEIDTLPVGAKILSRKRTITIY